MGFFEVSDLTETTSKFSRLMRVKATCAPIVLFVMSSIQIRAEGSGKEPLCGRINHCVVVKNHWTRAGWQRKTLVEKRFERPCGINAAQIPFENIGINISALDGDPDLDGWRKKPHLLVDLHTYKLTHVVASVSAPLDATFINFSHRRKEKDRSIIEVTCQDENATATSGSIVEVPYVMNPATRSACDKQLQEIGEMLVTKPSNLSGKPPFSIAPARLWQTVTWDAAPFKALARYFLTLKSSDNWECDFVVETSVIDEGKCGFVSARLKMCSL
jgi:hypothetical protein